MKKRKLIKWLILIVIVIVIIVAMIIGFELRIKDGGLYVGNSITTPYSYTIHSGYVVLEKYHGNEEVVELPKTILGRSVKELGFECFADNQMLERVVLNAELEVIGTRAFAGVRNLIEVTGGESVKRIEGSAFEYCSRLEMLDIGKELEYIDDVAFTQCYALKVMEPQTNLTYIGSYAFADTELETFLFGRNAIIECKALANTPWMRNQSEEFVIYGDGRLIGYNGTDKIVFIPEGVKTLVGGCFVGTMVKEIYVPDTVTTIQEYSFDDCNDVQVYIPESVVYMGGQKGRVLFPIKNDDVDLTIITTQDSYAHKYAIEHDIPVEIVEGW